MTTAEYVFPGHPDKCCDIISDAILDECIKADPYSRVAIETCGGHGEVFITGEVTSKIKGLNELADEIAYKTLKEIDYNSKELTIMTNIKGQSPDIAQGVDTGGAGDQGIMMGFACNETKSLMPLELELARKIGIWVFMKPGFGPDGKTQVTLNDDKTIRSVVISAMTKDGVITKQEVEDYIGQPIQDFYFNYTGKFELGGFDADAGCTGRKIVIDQYGPRIPVGGGAFSGKDATKVDRSAAYMARKIAVDYVRKGYDLALVQLAYVIGKAEPLQAIVNVERRVSGPIGGNQFQGEIVDLNGKGYDLTPDGIIKTLNLRRPIYKDLAKWGHFGREGLIWEK